MGNVASGWSAEGQATVVMRDCGSGIFVSISTTLGAWQ